jgi:hypothetical protein
MDDIYVFVKKNSEYQEYDEFQAYRLYTWRREVLLALRSLSPLPSVIINLIGEYNVEYRWQPLANKTREGEGGPPTMIGSSCVRVKSPAESPSILSSSSSSDTIWITGGISSSNYPATPLHHVQRYDVINQKWLPSNFPPMLHARLDHVTVAVPYYHNNGESLSEIYQ